MRDQDCKFDLLFSGVSREQEHRFSNLAGQVRMDLEPGRIGFMSTQRREDRSTPATELCRWSADATVGTAPPRIATAKVATKSLQSDHHQIRLARPARTAPQDIRRDFAPPGSADRTVRRRSSQPHIPFPSVFDCLHSSCPQFPRGYASRTERYDGKRDMYFQHAA